MHRFLILFLVLVFLVNVSNVYSQQSSGTVVVVVQEVKATVPSAIVIHDVPFASYDVVLSDGGKTIDMRRINISSTVVSL